MSEPCIRKRIEVDGENVYILVGLERGAMVTGSFENRQEDKPFTMAGAEKINETITELEALLEEK